MMDTSAWDKLSTEELQRKLAALRDLFESRTLIESSTEHQLPGIGLIEGVSSKRNDR